jgi:hypothetical protein
VELFLRLIGREVEGNYVKQYVSLLKIKKKRKIFFLFLTGVPPRNDGTCD